MKSKPDKRIVLTASLVMVVVVWAIMFITTPKYLSFVYFGDQEIVHYAGHIKVTEMNAQSLDFLERREASWQVQTNYGYLQLILFVATLTWLALYESLTVFQKRLVLTSAIASGLASIIYDRLYLAGVRDLGVLPLAFNDKAMFSLLLLLNYFALRYWLTRVKQVSFEASTKVINIVLAMSVFEYIVGLLVSLAF